MVEKITAVELRFSTQATGSYVKAEDYDKLEAKVTTLLEHIEFLEDEIRNRIDYS